MLTDFRNFFTVEFVKKFATNCLSHCPPHLKRVATLPCETTVVTNNHFHICAVNSSARHFLKHLSTKSPWIIRTSDDWLSPHSLEIWHVERWIWGLFSWLRTNSSTRVTLSLVQVLFGFVYWHVTAPYKLSYYYYYYSHRFWGSYVAVFESSFFPSLSREIQVISYSYNL